MNTPSTATMSSSIPRSPPGVVTFRYQHQMGSELAYVPLAATHEEAQEIAAHAFPTLLGAVDPSWLFFTMAVRYKSTGERKEIGISPKAWFYVTSKLVPYRLIDVHVVPPSGSPPGSAQKSYVPLYEEGGGAAKVAAPPYPADVDEDGPAPAPQGYAPPYPDSPPPRYPGALPAEKKKHPHPHPHMGPAGYGYGYGYNYDCDYDYDYGYGYGRGDYGYAAHGGGGDSRVYPELPGPPPAAAPRAYDPYFPEGRQEMADRRSAGWASSVEATPGRAWGGRALLSSIRQRIFPITWDESSRRARRRNHARHPTVQFATYEHENPYESTSKSGRSYVPSLI